MSNQKLKINDEGDSVLALQQALAERGFNPGALDGQFGQATSAAVAAFQASEGLLVDGVAGPRTQTLLGLSSTDDLPDISGHVSIQIVSQMFPTTRIDNIKKNLPPVIAALRHHDLTDKVMVLTALATIRAETEGFMPIDEGISKYNTSPSSSQPYDLYDRRKDLGNIGSPDGERFHGRGFIQLTGRSNYARYAKRLMPSTDLLNSPELANDTECAANLLALFLKDKQIKIKQALVRQDFPRAREQVNGGVHGLTRFKSAYLIGDQLLADGFH